MAIRQSLDDRPSGRWLSNLWVIQQREVTELGIRKALIWSTGGGVDSGVMHV